MSINRSPAGQVISTILKHDAKVTSYKIALLRAINDVALAFPDMPDSGRDIAIPLRMLAERWIAYYWPFVDQGQPIPQGPRPTRRGQIINDIAFRPALTALRSQWQALYGPGRPSDGFFLINELHVPRLAAHYPPVLRQSYERAIQAICQTIAMPIRYAGPKGEQWSIFARPEPYTRLEKRVLPLPGTAASENCLVVTADLWRAFQELSLWIEALCIHEWSLLSERVANDSSAVLDRGVIYRLLTDRPDNRRPLEWERNAIDLVLEEGKSFTCPWTGRPIRRGTPYDLDHLLPIAVYPINELWNLAPADPYFNQHMKRDRLPSIPALAAARPRLAATYACYRTSLLLHGAFESDVALRFSAVPATDARFPGAVAAAVTHFLAQFGELRNLARFRAP